MGPPNEISALSLHKDFDVKVLIGHSEKQVKVILSNCVSAVNHKMD